jgi:hypothetical protein
MCVRHEVLPQARLQARSRRGRLWDDEAVRPSPQATFIVRGGVWQRSAEVLQRSPEVHADWGCLNAGYEAGRLPRRASTRSSLPLSSHALLLACFACEAKRQGKALGAHCAAAHPGVKSLQVLAWPGFRDAGLARGQGGKGAGWQGFWLARVQEVLARCGRPWRRRSASCARP